MKDGKIALDEFVDFFATIVGPLGAYDVSLPNLTVRDRSTSPLPPLKK